MQGNGSCKYKGVCPFISYNNNIVFGIGNIYALNGF